MRGRRGGDGSTMARQGVVVGEITEASGGDGSAMAMQRGVVGEITEAISGGDGSAMARQGGVVGEITEASGGGIAYPGWAGPTHTPAPTPSPHQVSLQYYLERQCLLKCIRRIFVHAACTSDDSDSTDAIKEEATLLISEKMEQRLLSIIEDSLAAAFSVKSASDLTVSWLEESLIEIHLILESLFLAIYDNFSRCNGRLWIAVCSIYEEIADSLIEEQDGKKRTCDVYISFMSLLADPRYYDDIEDEVLVPPGKMGHIIKHGSSIIMAVKESCNVEIHTGGSKGPPERTINEYFLSNSAIKVPEAAPAPPASAPKDAIKKSYASINFQSILLILAMLAIILLPSVEAGGAEADFCSSPDLLSRRINGICVARHATPTCCAVLVSGFDNCLCQIMSYGTPVNLFISQYISCGGLNPDPVKSIKHCLGQMPSKPAATPEEVVLPRNNGISLLVYWILGVIGLVLFLWLVLFLARQWRKLKAARVAPSTGHIEFCETVPKQKRKTADELIRTQQVEIAIMEETPFLGPVTRARLSSLKEGVEAAVE